MTFSKVSDLVLAAPGIAWGFLHQCEELEEYNTPIRKQGGDGFVKGHRRNTTYRVCLSNGSALKDETKPSLQEAIEAVFEALNVKLPPELGGVS